MKCNKINLSSILFFVFVIFCNQTFAQMNNGIFFQAVARDNYSNPAKDRKIYVQSSIVQGSETGIKVLIEDHQTNTDATGVFGISIGLGTRKGGTVTNLNAVEWTKGPYYLNLKIAISPVAPAADWDYTKEWIDLGTTAFGTVPYALFAGSVAGFDAKLNSIDTAKMLLPYARVANLNTLVTNKVNVADSITKYVTPTQLASKTFDSTAIYRTIGTKLNIADSITKYVTPTQLAAKTFDSTAIYNQLALKVNTTDVNTSLALKANTSDVTTSLNLKENLNNKSIDVSADGTSDTKYPSTKAVKTFVESSITNSTVPDATALVKGKIQLTGDLAGTAANPIIANDAITTAKIANAAVTDAKINSVSGSKVTGNITGNAANITGNLAIVNGGTGATTAAGARTSLGLVIGTDVQAPLSFTAPINKNGNTVSLSQATSSVDGYLSAADFTIFNNKIDATQKAANNGVATLGNDGKIPSNQIPAISFQSANVVADQNAMLAISGAQVGSIAIRTDNNRNYVLSALPASTLSNWVQLAVPSSVTSVNGSAGPNVVLTTNDVSEGSNNKYYTDARVRSAINASTPLSFNSSTGIISMTAASGSTNGYLSSTDFTTFNNKQNAITAGVDYLAPNGSAANLTNFPTLNQNTTGNAATATKLASTKNINGVAFDGSANITVPADGNTLSGSTLASNITASSLTSVGTINSGIWSGTTIAIAKGGTGATTASAALTNLGAEPTANKSTATDLGALNPSDVLFPSQKAVKTYVDLQNANAGVADGSITNAKLAGSITANKLVGTDITTVGTITTGTWNGSTIAINKGGTGATTAAGARTNLGLVIGTDVMAANATTTLTGDVTGTGSGTFTTTLANSGVTANTYGSSTAIPVLTVDAKGRVTSASTVGIIAGVNTLTYTSGTTYANGGTISGTTLTLAAADGTNPGLISTGAQTIAGAKTFSSNVTAPNFIGDLNGNANSANSVNNAITFNNGGAGAISGATFNGNAAKTISYNTIGAAPAAGSSNITTLGTITSGTWNASTIPVGYGGTGVTSITGLIKGSGSTPFTAATAGVDYQAPLTAGSGIAISGGGIISASGITSSQIASNANILPSQIYDSKVTIGTTDVSLGGSATTLGGLSSVTATTFVGTLSGTASNANALTGSTLSNNIVNSSLTSVGTITSGIWSATTIDIAHGGTSLTSVGTNGQVLKSNGTTMTWADPSGVQSLNGLSTSNQTLSTSTSGNTFTITSSSGNHVINIPIASLAGVTNGLISNTEFNTFQNKQNAYTNLTSIGTLTNSGGFLKNDGNGTFSYTNPNKTDVGLGAVENISIGTWTGSTNITTLGTVNTGTWAGSVIADNKITTNLTGKTYNGLTLNSVANGFTVAGGTSSKTLTVASDANVSGTNTGDQTITLTGDVTGTGTGTFSTTINSVGGVNSSTISGFDTRITSNTSSITSLTSTVNANTNSITTNTNNIALRATIASPSFTGTPTAPTPTTGDNSTRIATTEYVQASITAANAGVSSVGPISSTANANGATISGSSQLILTPASANFGGVVTTATQTFAGAKTFSETATFNSDITVNGIKIGLGNTGVTSNTGVGFGTLSSVTSGTDLTALGYNALNKNTTGSSNTATGRNALLANTFGANNTAIGRSALESNTTGVSNFAGGMDALKMNTSGQFNTAIGGASLTSNTSGERNTAVGYWALRHLAGFTSTSSNNTAIGADAGRFFGSGTTNTLSSSSKGVFLGSNTRPSANLSENEVVIGADAVGNGSNTVTVGNLSNTATYFTGDINLTGSVKGGTWSGTSISIANGGTGATTAAGARANLGLVIGTNVQAPLTSGTDYIAPNASITGSTRTKITYDAKGLVTAGADATTADIAPSTNRNYVTDAQAGVISNTSGTNTGDETTATIKSKLGVSTLSGSNTGDQTITLTGDVTGTGTGSFAATLTNTTVTNGSYGSSTAIPTFTVDSKGRLTAASTASIIADAGTLTGTTLNSTVTSSSLTSVGTITSGVWSGTAIAIANGGTSATTKAAAFNALSPMTTSGDIIYGGASGTGTRLGIGTTGQVLTVSGGNPSWATPTGISTLTAIGATPNANGGTISGTSFNLQPASANFGGVVTTATQTFAGAKTFNSDIIANELTIGKGLYTATNSTNTAFGISALAATTNLSNSNVGVGYFAMNANTSGTENTSVGFNALKSNTTGLRNTVVGSGAMQNAAPTGSNVAQNTSIGAGSLTALNTGNSNTAVGYNTGSALTTGLGNVFIGNGAASGGTITNLVGTIIIGSGTMPAGNNDNNEIVIGYGATGLGSNSTVIGINSTTQTRIFGALELPSTTSTSSTTTGALKVAGGVGIGGGMFLGGDANLTSTTASTSTTTGALIVSGGAGIAGNLNVGGTLTIGGANAVLTTGAQTVAGAKTFSSNITSNGVVVGRLGGSDNVVLGNSALNASATSTQNTAIGNATLNLNTSGGGNTAVGYASLYKASEGTNNVSVGKHSSNQLTTGSNNVAVGADAGNQIISSSGNVFLGSQSGRFIGASGTTGNTTGSNSIFLGYQTSPLADGDDNEIVIAGGSTRTAGLGSNTTLIGNSSTTLTQLMGALNLPNTTTSTSTTTGALRVGGGAGIVGALNVGGATTLTGAATISNTTASSSTTTGALIVSGGTGIAGNTNIGGALSVTGAATLASANITGNGTIGGTLGVTGATTLTGATTISNTSNSNSTTTGALIVRGGVGVASNLTVGGTIEIDGGSPGAGKVLTSDANGLASWTYNGGNTSIQTGSYTITLSDRYVFYNGTATATFTLPAATSNAGKEIIIKNKSAFVLTIQRSGSETIFQENSTGNTAATSITLGIESSNNWVKLVSDGSQWNVFRALF